MSPDPRQYASDVALIHPPYVVHRERYPLFPIPWNLDHLGSTQYMEPYPMGPKWGRTPLGFHTMKHFIELNSPYTVNIYNLSSHVQSLPGTMGLPGQVETSAADSIRSYIGSLQAGIFAVGLHWVVHSHGAIEVLRMIKEIHPNSLTVIGGLSATYFQEEIMEHFPFIDCAVKGDGALPLKALLECRAAGHDFSSVPNILYRENGVVKSGPRVRLNDFERYWIKPQSTIQVGRGCPLQCVTCGGSKQAALGVWNYEEIRMATVDQVMESIGAFCRDGAEGNFYFIHDPLVTMGEKNWWTVLDEISRNDFHVNFRIEFYLPHKKDELLSLARCAPGSEIQFSPESMDPAVRDYHRNLAYSNEDLIMNMDTINETDELSLQVWFMAGVARDNPSSIRATLDFIEHYYGRVRNRDRTILKYNEMLFVDPGSMAFENPDQYGYRLLHKSFIAHRDSFVMPLFKYQMNYEMPHFSREELFHAFLEMHCRMNDIYLRNDCMDGKLHESAQRYNRLLEEYGPRYDRIISAISGQKRNDAFEELGRRLWEELLE